MQQQPDHLHGFSQAHVIGQTGAQAQARDEPQPAHAGLLIRTKLRAESRGISTRERLGRAKLLERLLERDAGGQSDPLMVLIRG